MLPTVTALETPHLATPHRLITGSSQAHYSLLTASPQSPHSLPTASSQPTHCLLTASSQPPHNFLTASSKPPHSREGHNVDASGDVCPHEHTKKFKTRSTNRTRQAAHPHEEHKLHGHRNQDRQAGSRSVPRFCASNAGFLCPSFANTPARQSLTTHARVGPRNHAPTHTPHTQLCGRHGLGAGSCVLWMKTRQANGSDVRVLTQAGNLDAAHSAKGSEVCSLHEST